MHCLAPEYKLWHNQKINNKMRRYPKHNFTILIWIVLFWIVLIFIKLIFKYQNLQSI